jgi:hypothetical protein
MMTEERQARSLRMAEVIDAYRVFPRMYLTLFFLGYCWLMKTSWDWYMAIDFVNIEVAKLTAMTSFPVILLTGIGGMFTSMYKNYQESGMDWAQRDQIKSDFKLKSMFKGTTEEDA